MSWALSYVVGPEYLRVMGIPLVRGRFFAAREDERASRVAVIDEVLAEKYFPGQDPVGRRLHLNGVDSSEAVLEIVGVVGHVKQWGLDLDDTQSLRAQLYTPFGQLTDEQVKLSPSGTTVLLRYAGASQAVLHAVERMSDEMNAGQVIFAPATMDSMIAGTLASRRVAMILLASFAVLALVLACGGLYGVVSYVVAQRTHEIGLRMALGAPRGRVLQMVLGQGARLSLAGIAIGGGAAAALTRLMSGLLYGIRPFDPLTFASVVVLLAACAALACWVPAARATLVDPNIALRQQ
jgi:predicted permease